MCLSVKVFCCPGVQYSITGVWRHNWWGRLDGQEWGLGRREGLSTAGPLTLTVSAAFLGAGSRQGPCLVGALQLIQWPQPNLDQAYSGHILPLPSAFNGSSPPEPKLTKAPAYLWPLSTVAPANRGPSLQYYEATIAPTYPGPSLPWPKPTMAPAYVAQEYLGPCLPWPLPWPQPAVAPAIHGPYYQCLATGRHMAAILYPPSRTHRGQRLRSNGTAGQLVSRTNRTNKCDIPLLIIKG